MSFPHLPLSPSNQRKEEERWHRETSASRWGNTASWLELRKRLHDSVWLGLVKMNLEMRPTGESGVTSSLVASLVAVISEGALESGGFL